MSEYRVDAFFEAVGAHVGLTYNDVRLRTGYSEVLPHEVDLATRFSRNIRLRTPLVTSPMDTVTTGKMAIQVAKLGGIGVIHRGLSIEDQASQVAHVKYHLHARVDNPVCVLATDKMAVLESMRAEKRFSFHSFPVVDENGRLVGLITRTNIKFWVDPEACVKDVMTPLDDLITASDEIEPEAAYDVLAREQKSVLPLVDEGGILKKLYTWKDLQRRRSDTDSLYSVDDYGQLRVAVAVGTIGSGDPVIERIERLSKYRVDAIVIDTAHGSTKDVLETLKEIKRLFPNIDVVVGNISEPEAAILLIEAGADALRIGQGPGSICTTRIVAGIGNPQFTAVYYCALAARRSGVPICADGGIVYSGDIPIAIGAGADTVMIGSLFAGTDAAPGEVFYHQGRAYKSYRGMGSIGAIRDSAGGSRYPNASETSSELVPEGVEGGVPYAGTLESVVFQLLGGLRKGMGYVGAATIQELQQNADYRLMFGTGYQESHPHDVLITKEPPNYRSQSMKR